MSNCNSIKKISCAIPPNNNIFYRKPVWKTIPIAIPSSPKKEIQIKEDLCCLKCNECYPFAEPNQEDGTLICYSCRLYL